MRERCKSMLGPAAMVVALLFAGVFLASIRYHVTIRHPKSWRLEISGGVARVNWDTGTPTASRGPTEYDAGTHSAPMEWMPRAYRRVGWPGFILPLWLPTLAAAASGAFLWCRHRRAAHGACPRCRYNLGGLPAGAPCPECGQTSERHFTPTD